MISRARVGEVRNYAMVQGDTWEGSWPLRTNGAASDLTNWTVYGAIKSAHGVDLGGTFGKDGSSVTLTITSAESARFGKSQDYQIELRQDDEVFTVLRGTFTTFPDLVT